MKTYKKIIILFVLLTSLSAYSFGETLFDFSIIGFHRLEESYLKAEYSRSANGYTLAFSFKHYQKESPWGFGAKVLIEPLTSTQEFRGKTEINKIWSPGTSLGLLLAPSYRFKLSEKVRIPLTFGPVSSLYFENTYYYDENNVYADIDASYEAFDLGLMVDASVVFTPGRRGMFFLKTGLSVEWDFLRVERGLMNTKFRHILYARSHAVPYMSAGITLDFGIGFLIK